MKRACNVKVDKSTGSLTSALPRQCASESEVRFVKCGSGFTNEEAFVPYMGYAKTTDVQFPLIYKKK